MGEFSPPPPPFFLSPFLSFFSYPSNIEIIFDFSDFHPHFTLHFKILDPRMHVKVNFGKKKSVIPLINFSLLCYVGMRES